jgi:hypothetical protein
VMFWRPLRKCGAKKPELWRNHNWLLHHDNAPVHTSLKSTQFVTNNNMVIVPHPPYSPNLAPCDFALNETEGTKFWNSVSHPKGIASDTWQQ